MSQKITCPHCEKEFPMEEGLKSHLKTLEDQRIKKIENEQGEKIKEKEKKLKELEDSNKNKDDQLKSFKEQKDHEIKKAVESNRFQFCSLHLHLLNPKNIPLAKIALKNAEKLQKVQP